MKLQRLESKNNMMGLKIGKIEITLQALILSLLIVGFVLMAVLNIGYDKKKGCYWRPLDVDIDVKLDKEAK